MIYLLVLHDIFRMRIDRKKHYTAREAASLLGKTEATVKKYLRDKVAKGIRVGPSQRWHIPGAEILRLRAEWNLDAIK